MNKGNRDSDVGRDAGGAPPDGAARECADTEAKRETHSLANESSVQSPPTGEPVAGESFADVLGLIGAVRQSDPDCLSDMVDDEGKAEAPISGDRRIGRFEIREQLGQGGFGMVFLAFDPQLERCVALKIPRFDTLATETTRARFLREAKVVAALSHPNIATVHESGQLGPVCYIASTYHRGGSLADHLAFQPRLPIFAAADVVAELAAAVQHAHSRGVLHRDLKPANVLLDFGSPDEDDDQTIVEPEVLEGRHVRITDFGLAKLIDDAEQQTATGAVLGTPAYAAPEQLEGQLAEITTASDVYSLGVILYELLTGELPFQGKTALATLDAMRTSMPPSPRKLRPEIDRDLESICLRCIDPSPPRRYASAAALSDDLRRWSAGEPVTARPVSTIGRYARWCIRNPALAVVSLLLVAALVAGTIVSTAQWRRAERHAEQLVDKGRQLESAVDRLSSAIDKLFVLVAESPQLKAQGAEPLRQALLTQAEEYYSEIVALKPSDPKLRHEHARTVFLLARVHSELGGKSRAEELAKEAIAELETLPVTRQRRMDKAGWQRMLGKVLHDQGRFQDGREVQQQATAAIDALLQDAPDDSRRRELKLRLARLWVETATGQGAAANLRESDKAIRRATELFDSLRHPVTAHSDPGYVHAYACCLLQRGINHQERGELGASESQLIEAMELVEPVVANQPVEEFRMVLGRTYKRLGIAVARQRRFEEARNLYHKAAAIFKQLIDRHPRVPEYVMERIANRYSLAGTEFESGKHDLAIELLDSNINDYETLALNYPELEIQALNRSGKYWNLIYVVHARHERWKKAVEAMRSALDCYRQVDRARPDWIDNIVALSEGENNYGNLLRHLSRHDEAMKQYMSARDRMRPVAARQPRHQRVQQTLRIAYEGIATVYLHDKKYAEALRANDAALAVQVLPLSRAARLRRVKLLYLSKQAEDAGRELRSYIDSTARLPDDFIAAARIALDISSEPLARQALRQGKPHDPAAAARFQSRLEADPRLRPLLEAK